MSHREDDRICVIGAGPAGLAAGAALRAAGIPFEILDEGRAPGGIWDIGRERTPMYDSAHFITSRTMSAFPGFPMPADYPDYPRHDLVLAYIQAYAEHHGIPGHIRFGERVTRATPQEDGAWWEVETAEGDTRRYGALVVASGITWLPNLPSIPGHFEGELLHSSDYRDPTLFAGKRVLIVGGGNSGCDIACDAARASERAMLSLRRGYWFIPKYVLGMPADVFAHAGPQLPPWLERRLFEFLIGRVLVGNLEKRGLPRPDHHILESHPIMNTRVLDFVGHGDLEIRGDVTRLDGRTASYADGREDEVDVVVLATGYHMVFPFLEGELSGEAGPLDLYLNVFHRRLDSLFFLGQFETDGAAYPLLGLQAQALAGALRDRRDRPEAAERFGRMRASERPRVRGRSYLASERHDYYVTNALYAREMERLRKRMGWSRAE